MVHILKLALLSSVFTSKVASCAFTLGRKKNSPIRMAFKQQRAEKLGVL